MTANQLAYLNYAENQRSNIARETETQRANLAHEEDVDLSRALQEREVVVREEAQDLEERKWHETADLRDAQLAQMKQETQLKRQQTRKARAEANSQWAKVIADAIPF